MWFFFLIFFFLLQRKAEQFDPIVEQIGSYDPMPNEYNEKLLALNVDRVRFWMGKGADVSPPVAEFLGMFSAHT